MLPILIEALATNEAITLLFQTILIFGMLSFLWKTNPYYTVTEQMMIGGRTAVFFLVMLEGIIGVFGDIAAGMVWRIIPVVMGVLFFVGLTRIRWAGRYPNAIITGGGLGVLFGLSLRAQIVDQMASSIMALVTFNPDPISGVIIFVGTILTVSYFLYTYKQEGPLAWTSRIARWFMAISFGNMWAQIIFYRLDGLIACMKIVVQDFLLRLF